LATKPNEYLVEFLLLVDCARRLGAEKIIGVLPYVAYMRQDRLQDQHAFSGPFVAQLLSSVLDGVIVVEPHTPQASGFFTIPVHEISTHTQIRDLIADMGESLVVVSPDAGGIKRAEMVKPSGADLAVVEKQRRDNDVSSIELLGDVSGKNCVIVDDVLVSGATIKGAVALLMQHGAKTVDVYVTHVVFPDVIEQLLNDTDIRSIVTGDTVAGIDKKYAKMSVKADIVATITQLNGEKA
jgi:ribose-phosphate pyrophosphokinase